MAETAPKSTKYKADDKDQNSTLQYGLSLAVGILTILLFATSYYSGIIH